MSRVQEQRRAVAKLIALDATISYGAPWTYMLPYWLQWQINSLLPTDDLSSVVEIKFDNKKLKGDRLAAVEELPYVARLELFGCPVCDADIKHLRKSNRLISLNLEALRCPTLESHICRRSPTSRNCR